MQQGGGGPTHLLHLEFLKELSKVEQNCILVPNSTYVPNKWNRL